MEVIVDELRRNNITVDITMLSQYIHYILENHEGMYDNAANHLNSDDLVNVFNGMNISNIGRALAYLALVYRMDIPEDKTREAVRLAVPSIKDIARGGHSLIRRICSGVGYVLHSCSLS